MFYQLDADIMQRAEKLNVRGSDFELLIKILVKSNNTLGGCWASNKTLGESLKMNFATISRKISKLIRKGLLKVEYLFTNGKRGKKMTINGKEYLVYRVLTPNVKKEEKSNEKSIQKQNDSKKHKKTSYQELFQKAIEKAKQRKDVRNINAYARGVVKQWKKQGIFNLEQLAKYEEVQRNTTKSRNRIVEKLPSWAQQNDVQVKKTQPLENKNIEKTKKEINTLMKKLGIKNQR